ncbi:hypothetical protein KI387_013919, partial [Taxus chinensis]
MIYARICVLMDLNNPLLAKISLKIETDKWEQMVDYENIPFCCRIYHEYGHLVKDCTAKMPKSKEGKKNKDKFVTPKKKQVTKQSRKEHAGINTSNKYTCLQVDNEEEKVEDLMESQIPETQLDKPTTVVTSQPMDIQHQLVIFQANPNNANAQRELKNYQRKTKFNDKFQEQNQDPKEMENLGKALIIRKNNKSYQEEQSLGVEQEQHKKFKVDANIKMGRKSNQLKIQQEGQKLSDSGTIRDLSQYLQ